MKYPILLIHGMGFRDDGKIGYWGRIPKTLENNGYNVSYSKQDGNGSVVSNAMQIAEIFDDILKEYGTDKLNIIAHSKGGLEARYLASTMGFGDKIASITTLSTPHNGSTTVDNLMKFPNSLIKFGCKVTDLIFKLKGDQKPDTYSAILSFTTANANRFNLENPNLDNIYYQSYAFVMSHSWSDMFIWFPNLVVRHYDGENDGLLSPTSVKWGNFKGVIRSNSYRGISHCDEVDMRRMKLSKKQGDGISDITELYLDIARDIEKMGF